MSRAPAFHLVGAAAVRTILAGRHADTIARVAHTYAQHGDGRTTNPDSYFLRFADRPADRIIALPAHLRDGGEVAGIKWIASVPANRERGLPRASAVIVLNDVVTGFPYACLEGSLISAARTAASAALAAELLHGEKRARALAVVGAGPIAAAICDYLIGSQWNIERFVVHDLVAARSEALCASLRERGLHGEPSADVRTALETADLVVLATTAGTPYLCDPAQFTARHTVLHVSLRDLGTPVIRAAQNVVDDVEHCLKAQTSVHLAEQETGGRAFIAGTIADLIAGRLRRDSRRPRIFSPFGLGVLDLGLARFVYEEALRRGLALDGGDFFALAPG